jgi:hypothetical protein
MKSIIQFQSCCFIGQIVIESDETGLYQLQKKNRTFIIDIEGHVISCDQSETLFFQNCFQIEESIVIVDGCRISIDDETLEESLFRIQKPFKFNSISKQRHFNEDPLFPNCNSEWNKVKIRKSLSSWICHRSLYSSFHFGFTIQVQNPWISLSQKLG